MTTTVLLQSWDEGKLLRRSLPAAMAQDGAKVVVVDNASSDDTAEVARANGAELLRLEPRHSYARAMNEAIRATNGEAVLLLNADCFLEPGFLRAACARLGEDGVGSVAPKLLRTLGPEPEQRLDAIDAAGLVVDRRRKNTLVGHGRPALAYDLPGEAFGADGAAALYRRETLEDCAVEGEVLDEDLERWASDVDLAWRSRTLGWRCVFEPGAVAYHVRYYSPSTRNLVPERDRTMQFRNRYLMMAKNDTASALARDLPRVAAYEMAALGWALVAERHLLGGYAQAARLLPRVWPKRRVLRSRRRERGSASAPLALEAAP